MPLKGMINAAVSCACHRGKISANRLFPRNQRPLVIPIGISQSCRLPAVRSLYILLLDPPRHICHNEPTTE